MEVKITTLSENTANYGYLAEWGLSILVEVNETRILTPSISTKMLSPHSARKP